ncbi:MAG: ABC transporter permease [Saprospiraceae bacterium]
MKTKVNIEIALTHISKRKRQTLIASLGVTIGLALYIFSNSLMDGFAAYSRAEMFKTIPHIKVFKADEISKPLMNAADSSQVVVVSNPSITTLSKNIIDPYRLLNDIKKQPYIINAAPQVNVDLFYNVGEVQLKGVANGVHIMEADAMFDIQSTLLAGDLQSLSSNLNAIIIGKGIAEKMNVRLDDNITITSALGIIKVMKVVGIFTTGNKATDESKSYIHISAAQQLVKRGPTYITDIYASVNNPDSSLAYAAQLQQITDYKVEDWQTSNADTLATDRIRKIMNSSVAMAIMMVAAFGIYNILNMTITQKMNDIAILKATGFAGKDIVQVFVFEALVMGVLGTVLGLGAGAGLTYILSNVYIGDPIGYFPIYYDARVFITSAAFGLLFSLGAGYLPARKAAKIDPVEIFRK